MDKVKLFEEIGIYIDTYYQSTLQGFKLGKKIHLERKPAIFQSKEGPSKYEVFFEILKNKLNLIEANYLLKKHNFAFDPSEKFDLIIEYCISNDIYDIHIINEVLKHFIGEQI